MKRRLLALRLGWAADAAVRRMQSLVIEST